MYFKFFLFQKKKPYTSVQKSTIKLLTFVLLPWLILSKPYSYLVAQKVGCVSLDDRRELTRSRECWQMAMSLTSLCLFWHILTLGKVLLQQKHELWAECAVHFALWLCLTGLWLGWRRWQHVLSVRGDTAMMEWDHQHGFSSNCLGLLISRRSWQQITWGWSWMMCYILSLSWTETMKMMIDSLET